MTDQYGIEENYEVFKTSVWLDKGTELNKTNIWDETPLNRAVLYGKKDMVKLLIDSGADQNIASDEGQTPLSRAQEKGHSEIVKILKALEPPIGNGHPANI